jgi:UDP-N-acetyl-D-mannosaminuronic acid dehydrogenase
MGYVGIPYTMEISGIQRASPRSKYKIDLLNEGKIPFRTYEPEMGTLLEQSIQHGSFHCTSDPAVLEDCDAILVTVQTPFTRSMEPDYAPMEQAMEDICEHMPEDPLISIESTITPGYIRNVIQQTLDHREFTYSLVHAPERVTPGKMIHNIRHLDRVVGGVDERSTVRGTDLYSRITTHARIIETDATTAETIKTAENTFRDMQIAAVNQLALYCEAIGVNVYDVRTGIDSLQGAGVTRAILKPGAGVGGHCLTKDTYHLERGVKNGDTPADYPEHTDSLFTLSRRINDFMPIHMLHLAKDALLKNDLWIYNAQIAVLGMAYDHDSDDFRNSPTEKFCKIFGNTPAKIRIHDPFADFYEGDFRVSGRIDETVKNADAILIFTAHKEYFYLKPDILKVYTGKDHPVIVDGRNVIDPGKFIREGYIYRGIGRGDMNTHAIIHRDPSEDYR